jgi:hypothetical protein
VKTLTPLSERIDRQPATPGGPPLDREDVAAALRTGDVILIRTGSGIGRIVRALDRSAFNHCAIHVGHGRCVHVLPPRLLRGSCVVVQPFGEMVATLDPQAMDVRRPPSGLAGALAAGARAQERLGPAFSYNDLLLLATVADTSDRLANAIAPVGDYLCRQEDWEAVLGAHFGLAGPEAITCSGLVVRSLPETVGAALTRTRRQVPESWQEAIRPDEALAAEVDRIVAQAPMSAPRLHRRRGYAPLIAALDRYAVESGLDDLEDDQLRIALTVLRHLAADFNDRHPLDLRRLRTLLDTVLETDRTEWLARLTTPGDLARSTEHLCPTGLTWMRRTPPRERDAADPSLSQTRRSRAAAAKA